MSDFTPTEEQTEVVDAAHHQQREGTSDMKTVNYHSWEGKELRMDEEEYASVILKLSREALISECLRLRRNRNTELRYRLKAEDRISRQKYPDTTGG